MPYLNTLRSVMGEWDGLGAYLPLGNMERRLSRGRDLLRKLTIVHSDSANSSTMLNEINESLRFCDTVDLRICDVDVKALDQLLGMTSPEYVKIVLWGEQWHGDDLKLFKETASLHPKRPCYPPIENHHPAPPGPPPAHQDFLRMLSHFRTVETFFNVILVITPSDTWQNPAHYRVSEVSITKRRHLIQHEGIVVRVHHQSLPSDQGFFIFIDRDIDWNRSGGSSSTMRKWATDYVNCRATHLPPRSASVIWRVAPCTQYTFNINLAQMALLLDTVSSTNQTYNALRRNCFWYTGLTKRAIEYIIQRQQPFGPHGPHGPPPLNLVAPDDIRRLPKIGTCWLIRLGTRALADLDIGEFLEPYFDHEFLQPQVAE